MSNCCNTDANNAKSKSKLNCLKCLETAKSVSKATVFQQLSFPVNLDLASENYFYCANSNCDISYFSESGQSYNISQLRNKIEIQQGWLCYCFDISKKQYQHALDNGAAIKIKNFVIKQTKLHQCSCNTRNPSGQCCLAEFKRMEKQL